MENVNWDISYLSCNLKKNADCDIKQEMVKGKWEIWVNRIGTFLIKVEILT